MMLTEKVINLLLNELNLSRSDVEKFINLLNKVDIKTVDGKTFIDIRLNKISIILESDKDEF